MLAKLEAMRGEDLQKWLARALHGLEPLPRLSPDESAHIAVLRLDQGALSRALRGACLELVRDLSSRLDVDVHYAQELMFLTTAFNLPEATVLLADMARQFSQHSTQSKEIEIAVLSALVHASPPQSIGFWLSILSARPGDFGLLALSALLKTNPSQAVQCLPFLPNTPEAAGAVVLKLELTWDELKTLSDRVLLIDALEQIAPEAGNVLVSTLSEWIASKRGTLVTPASRGLQRALATFLGNSEAKPRHCSSKLLSSTPPAP